MAHLESALAWYERLAGRPADLVPNETEAAWQLAGTAWIYVVADAERAGTALLTLLVDDLDGTVAKLTGRELAPREIQPIPGVGRESVIVDPEGNRITFAEPFAP